MTTYKVSWTETTYLWATVDADSPEEAIEKAKRGEHNDDTDSDSGPTNMKSFKCDGVTDKADDRYWQKKRRLK